MKNRIYLNMLFLTVVSVTLAGFASMVFFHTLLISQVKNKLESEATILKSGILDNNESFEHLKSIDWAKSGVRLSIISPEGNVLFDSFANAANMENHLNREEITAALKNGTGESSRFSSTLRAETYYFAARLENGGVLRLSQTVASVYGVFYKMLPAVLVFFVLILIACRFIALSLTNKIINPINNMDWDNMDAVVYDELSPFITTIKRQKEQIDEQLTVLENRANTIAAITANMKEGLVLIDSQAVIVSANKSATEFFKTDDNCIGKNIIEVMRNIEIFDKIKAALSGVSSDLVFEGQMTGNGFFESKSYNIFFSPVLNGGALILILDITDKSKAEKIRKEFSANVSHELKTPLTIISGYAEMVVSGIAKSSDINNFAGKIKDETARLINLIEEIMMLSQLDEKEAVKTYEKFDLIAVASQAAENLRENAAANNIGIELPEGGMIINANRRLIYDMLFNLLDNAIKYNKHGGKVTVDISGKDLGVTIVVSDTGIGIPEKHLERIFERFYRVDKSRSKKTGGTGLGLSIVKHIAQYHGGTVQITSHENVGTSLVVKI